MPIVVDLFAGPGGLGEGFSSQGFDILVSAEKDPVARQTLRLRAFYRYLQRHRQEWLSDYYDYCHGRSPLPWTERSREAWQHAENEAQIIELGSELGNNRLYEILDDAGINRIEPWVLIGGPPCQAYSLVGRARNKGKQEYRPEEDHRHFLYREYLNIIGRYQPAVFVMENVKGILSAKVGDERIFHSVLRDLAAPDGILGQEGVPLRYRICSLVSETEFRAGDDPAAINPADYVIRAEQYGIPQARHRVILLGIREDLNFGSGHPQLTPETEQISVKTTIGRLPPLRSRLSKEDDDAFKWQTTLLRHASLLAELARAELRPKLNNVRSNYRQNDQVGALRYSGFNPEFNGHTGLVELDRWFLDSTLNGVWLNHESRGHMSSDLRRYLYAASFAAVQGNSPKGHTDFDIDILRPEHKNWESGNFSDRFRVQLSDRPSTTITSHISKDGHYFIHYDPIQCRSLTVREAARLQTFPDNYFFEGNRTQQYHQVGNAVPPLLASKIAKLVQQLIQRGIGLS